MRGCGVGLGVESGSSRTFLSFSARTSAALFHIVCAGGGRASCVMLHVGGVLICCVAAGACGRRVNFMWSGKWLLKIGVVSSLHPLAIEIKIDPGNHASVCQSHTHYLAVEFGIIASAALVSTNIYVLKKEIYFCIISTGRFYITWY